MCFLVRGVRVILEVGGLSQLVLQEDDVLCQRLTPGKPDPGLRDVGVHVEPT